MATRFHGLHSTQYSSSYIHKKGIHELFEAIMTALMVHKPDDHITFIRECLDKVQNNPSRLRWDHFVTNTSNVKSITPSKLPMAKTRQKSLPPVRGSTLTTKTHQAIIRQTPIKTSALPPIEHNKKSTQNLPVIFILSSSGSTKLCSRLIERYNGISYLLISDVANIDDDHPIDLRKHDYRYDCVHNAIEQRHSDTKGFIIAGHYDERNFIDRWHEKLGRIDLVIVLSSDRETMSNLDLDIIQINPNIDFDIVLADTIRAIDDIFPHHTHMSEYSRSTESTINHFSLPIIFCIDIHRLLIKENHNSNDADTHLLQRLSIDDEFDGTNEGSEVESNNSFIYTLCERLAEQFSFKHIHFGDYNNSILNFDELKTAIIESMSSCNGYIIEHFPTSLDELERFQTEIGPCSALIYIGDYQTENKRGDLNIIVEKFIKENKAIYIDCRMEVDEIYEDLNRDIVKRL